MKSRLTNKPMRDIFPPKKKSSDGERMDDKPARRSKARSLRRPAAVMSPKIANNGFTPR